MILEGYLRGRGKLGNIVTQMNANLCIAREYRATINNPSTTDQVGQRARFKLASQVSASLASVIVIPKRGVITGRNQFVSNNMPYFYGDEFGASVMYDKLQITAGASGMPRLLLARNKTGLLTLSVNGALPIDVDRIIYNVFKQDEEAQLQLVNSVIVSIDEDNDQALVDVPDVAGDLVVYAYGMKDKNDRAKAKYNSYSIQSGEDVARLIATRTLNNRNYRFTRTVGAILNATDSESIVPNANEVLATIHAGNATSVVATIGENAGVLIEPFESKTFKITKRMPVKLQGSAQTNFHFMGWYKVGEQLPYTEENPLIFTATESIDIIARSQYGGGLE